MLSVEGLWSVLVVVYYVVYIFFSPLSLAFSNLVVFAGPLYKDSQSIVNLETSSNSWMSGLKIPEDKQALKVVCLSEHLGAWFKISNFNQYRFHIFKLGLKRGFKISRGLNNHDLNLKGLLFSYNILI